MTKKRKYFSTLKYLLLVSVFCTLSIGTPSTLSAQSDPTERLAIQHYQNREFDKARELFKSIFSKKQDSYIYYYYYRTLLELQEYKELEKVVKQQQRRYPQVQRYKIDLGYLYELTGKMKDANKVYEDVIKNVPNTEHGYRELYSAFLSIAKRDYAETVLIKGRKNLNNPKLYSKELTNIYQQLNQTEKIIEEVISLVSDDDEKYLSSAQEILQNMLMDESDLQKKILVSSSLKKAIQKDPDNLCFLKLNYWVALLNKEYNEAFILARSIDRKSRSEGEIILEFAQIAKENRAYEIGIQALESLIEKGDKTPFLTTATFELLNIKYLVLTTTSPVVLSEARALEKEFKEVIDQYGSHSGTVEWVRKYAHLLAFYVNKPKEALQILDSARIKSGNDKKIEALYKIDMADIYLHTNEIWEATLLYSQVDKSFPNDTIGHLAKFKNAKLSFYIGEFAWAQSQLDILRAATSKFIANDAMYLSFLISDNLEDDDDDDFENNDEGGGQILPLFKENPTDNLALRYFAKADFLMFQNNDQEALKYLDSLSIFSPLTSLNDDVLYRKATIATKQKDYFAAEKYYLEILQYYSSDILADDALFKLAELYEYYLVNIPESMAAYQRLLKDYPGSIYVVDARKRYRYLRGDQIE